MSKKILASDYDRTFYLSDVDINKNINAVKEFRKKGNIFIIATGRSYLDFQKKLNLYEFSYDYVIINHGATILDVNDNIISNYVIEDNIVNNVKLDLQLEKCEKWFCCSELESRVNFEHKKLTKINVKYNSPLQANFVNDLINNKYSKYVHSYRIGESSIEIISSETNKSKAIKIISDRLHVSSENVYTIGDGHSDVEMVKDFNGYAVFGAIPEVKAIAKGEYKSVSELILKIM